MQTTTTAARRLSQVIGLGNESTSSYTSAAWDRDLEQFDHNVASYHSNEYDQQSPDASILVQNSIATSSKREVVDNRVSSESVMDSTSGENAFHDDDKEEEEEWSRSPSMEPRELVSRMKMKMSMFLAIRKTSDTPDGSSAPASHVSERDMEFPTLHRSAERRHPRPKQGAGMPTSTSRPKRGAAIQSQHQVHMLSTLQLISLTFFAVSGGPYGFEATVGAGGPGLMLLGLLVVPLIWAAPLALMTAELSCMIPESGGHVLWVYRAFGPFWSFVNSCCAFVWSILDNAMYPVLFVEYLAALIYEGKDDMPHIWSVFIKILLVFVVTIINIIGINIVGIISVILGIMVLAPFITMCLIGLTHLNFDWMGLDVDDEAPSTQPSPSAPIIDWGKFLTLLLWNTSGFDAAGTIAAEVRNPGQAFPRALSISVGLMIGVYALPTIIGVSVLPDSRLWKEGTYIIVAKLIGGNILKVVLIPLHDLPDHMNQYFGL